MARLLLLLALAAPLGVLAQDEEIEKRVTALAVELRCLVCQNQTLADSNAPLAVDLRNQIREQLKAGKSEQDVVDFMVARYGDFVLYRPPLKATTVLLWAGPFALLLIVIVLLLRRLRSRAERAAVANTLSADEHERARALLAGEENKV